MIWKLPENQIHLESFCYLGILNLTPDSFSDGGKYIEPLKAIAHARELLAAGAQVIDIGDTDRHAKFFCGWDYFAVAVVVIQ